VVLAISRLFTWSTSARNLKDSFARVII